MSGDEPAGDGTPSPIPATARGPGRRRRLGWLGVGIVLVALVAGGAWLAGTRVRSPDQAAADAAAPARTVVTAPVVREVLESTVVTRGDVGPELAVPVTGPTPEAGQAVVTGVFLDVGDTVDSLAPVVEVSGRPVFVMEGERPVYRTLGPEMTGADVRQLQAGLVANGCAAGDSGIYDGATKECVAEMYESGGYTLVRSSPTEEADLASSREAKEDAADALDDAEAALADAAAGPTELELLDGRQAVDTARANVDAATSANDDRLSGARAAVGDALRALNEQLVAVNPDTDNGAGDSDNGGDAGGAGGAGGAATGVAGRADAAAALSEALDGVVSAQVEGEVALGEADAALTRAQAALDQLEAPPDLADEQRAVDQAAQQLDRATVALATLEASSGPTVPLGELVFVPLLPATVDSVAAAVGQPAGSGDPTVSGGGDPAMSGGGGALIVLSSAGLVVTSEITAGNAGLVAVGDSAQLLDERSGVVVGGEVTNIGALTESTTGGMVAEVTLSGVADLPPEWSGTNIRVTFVAASTGSPVLVVPELAVSSGSDGQERVEVVGDDGSIREVKVRTGLSTEGKVEVTPMTEGELQEGDKVVTDR